MKARVLAAASTLAMFILLGASVAMSQVSFGVGIRFGPPPPRHEVVVVAPYPDGVWIRGYWAWDEYAGQYVWVPGRWEHARPYETWVDGSWHHGSRGWAWREGYWRHRDRHSEGRHEQHERHGRHDEGRGRHERDR